MGWSVKLTDRRRDLITAAAPADVARRYFIDVLTPRWVAVLDVIAHNVAGATAYVK